MPIKRVPTTLPTGVQHARPWKDGARSLKVPLWHANAKGEWLEGAFNAPARLACAAPDTNERHAYDRLVREMVDRWVEWRKTRGWEVASEVYASDPQPLPRSTVKPKQKLEGELATEVDEELRRVWLRARFKRSTPLYVGLEDFLFTQEEAQRYGIKTPKDPLPWNDTGGKGDSGWVDPLKYAEERRQRLGLKRKDLLFGPLDEPL